MDEKTVPNPGSDAARSIGCTCPTIDNGYGAGSEFGPNIFFYDPRCPVHQDDIKKFGIV